MSGTPGEKTLKNFLATALTPVGTSLYVYGGSWDWQDVNSSNQSMTIGLSQSWIDFFQSQDANYTYKYNADHSEKRTIPMSSGTSTTMPALTVPPL